ncbi:hypothetical protein C2845_PM12G14680 [Panicum miliaceum]|uniref:Protein FAR1-RELATED SEQUENCE n=1 Tax=Panicum miliaceum TaxID=4540 RepID=A0A3L6QGU9_PANMI|nr:hypothetical protein C2845_PM12G14680 [Panicum miliaceum]
MVSVEDDGSCGYDGGKDDDVAESWELAGENLVADVEEVDDEAAESIGTQPVNYSQDDALLDYEINPTVLGDCRCVTSDHSSKKRSLSILQYSWEVGFGIRFGTSSRNRVNKYRTMQELVCEKEGEWNSHSKIGQCIKDMIRYLRENNVSLSRVHCIMGSIFGSMENIPFNQRTIRAVCAQIAKDQKDDDLGKTLEVFRKMRAEDPGFQFSVDLDGDKKIKTLIWTSGWSRSQYALFGDAITFDTTYCTNIYKIPFGIFVGVNNHFQSVLSAGVLMRDETAKFCLVFKEFLTLMGGKAPITHSHSSDQCKAMTRAIREVMPPGTTHLWCKWHILKDAPEEFGPLFGEKSPFRREFIYIINEMLAVDGFEAAWQDLVERYDLKNHAYMQRTYNKRKMWAKPWAKDKFCARVASTQRSESANSILKKVIPRNCSMNRFVDQYRKLLIIRASPEHKAEHKTKQFKPRAKRVYAIEKHAISIYTKNTYGLFRQEVDRAAQYRVVQGSDDKQFFAVHSNAEFRKKWARMEFCVTVENDGEKYNCECGLYNHFGMLCCHAIKVLIYLGVPKIPDAHIMKRAEADQDAADILMGHLNSARKEISSLLEGKQNQPAYNSASGCSPDTDAHSLSESDPDLPSCNKYGAAGSSAYMSDSDLESMRVPTVDRQVG